MQLGFSFSLLLATLVLALSSTVEAAPTIKRSSGMITLPLKRITQNRDDVEPLVLLQQHINRGLKRGARMAGREAPSDLELRENLHKRMFIPPAGRRPNLEARYNRGGVSRIINDLTSQTLTKANNAATKGRKGKGRNRNKNNAAAAAAAAAAAGGAGAAATGNTNTGNATTTATGNTNTGAGFSQTDLAAALSGGLTAANTPTAANSLGLNIEANDVGYIATVQMGTPPRDFRLLMDSGSADLWVGAEGCQSQAGGDCGNHVFLGAQSSSSFVNTNQQFQVTYGSGAVAGDIVTDDITVAGLKLAKHTFGVALAESVQFSSDSTDFDGLMGLAQSTLSQQQTLTPVEALAKQGLITDAITSYKISRLSDGKNDGEITFGGLDTTKFDAKSLVTFNNINKDGFWEGSMSVSVDGQAVGLNGRTAILDTGTTLIIAPPADAAAVHAAIPGAKSDGQGGFTVPCTTTASVALTFAGQTFDINPQDLLFAPVDVNNLQGDCISGISSGQIGGAQQWLVGDVFLKNAYFSHDVTKNSISLAKLV